MSIPWPAFEIAPIPIVADQVNSKYLVYLNQLYDEESNDLLSLPAFGHFLHITTHSEN